MKRRRIYCADCGGFSNASARARLFAYLPYVRNHGIRAHVASYTYHRFLQGRPHTAPEKLWLELLGLRNFIAFMLAGTVWFQRNNFRTSTVQWAKRLSKRVVYDFDDAIYLIPPGGDAQSAPHIPAENRDIGERVEWMLGRADGVIVSGAELREWAMRCAREVRVIPSVVHNAAEAVSDYREPPVIGWVGAPENQRYLMKLENTLLRLQEKQPDAEVWIITSRLWNPAPRFRHRFIPWSRAAEAEFIPQFAAGLAPLDDDPWCRAKMNFKAIVYMSHGVPAIVSPIGFPVADFKHGESVWYAHSDDEWLTAMNEALGSRSKRNDVAHGALNVLRDKYTAKAQAENWIAAVLGNDE